MAKLVIQQNCIICLALLPMCILCQVFCQRDKDQSIGWMEFKFNKKVIQRRVRKLNPLVNTRAMLKLNPFATVMKRKAVLAAQKRLFDRELKLAEKRGIPVDIKKQKKIKMHGLRKAQIKKMLATKPKKAKSGKVKEKSAEKKAVPVGKATKK